MKQLTFAQLLQEPPGTVFSVLEDGEICSLLVKEETCYEIRRGRSRAIDCEVRSLLPVLVHKLAMHDRMKFRLQNRGAGARFVVYDPGIDLSWLEAELHQCRYLAET